jgi:hypothetical protein
MRARTRLGTAVVLAFAFLLAAPSLADDGASVGKVTVLQGAAKRRAPGGEHALRVGSAIQLGDVVLVGAGARLKMKLNDESVIMLDENSELTITEADFENQVRKGFAATLGIGKFWAKVKKAVSGSDAKFEVTTDRAVAGVRGTIFRVDTVSLVQGSTGMKGTRVRVTKGKVAVNSRFNDQPQVARTSARVQIQGPQEITAQEWEEKFVELQKGWAVTVGEAGYWQVEPKSSEPQDAFAKFIQANDDGNE